jgi:hypothetical protein
MSLGRAVLAIGVEGGKEFDAALDAAKKKGQGLQASFEGVGKSLSSFGKSTAAAGKSLSLGVTAPIVGVVGALGGLALAAASTGDEIAKRAREAGLSAQSYQELKFALSQVADVSEEELVKGFGKATIAIADAANGNKQAIATLTALGFSQQQIASGALTTEQVIAALNSTMQTAATDAQAMAIAGDLVGDRLGPKLAGALRDGGAEVDALREQFQQLGLGMSDEALAASEKFGDQMDVLQQQFAAVGREVGTAVLPLLTETLIPFLQETGVPVLKSLIESVSGVVKWFIDLPAPVQAVIGGAVGLAAALGPVLVGVGAVASAIGAALPVIGTIGGALVTLATGPVGLIVAAVAGLVLAWAKWDAIKGFVADVWQGVKTFAGQVAQLLAKAGPLLGPVGLVFTVWKNWELITGIAEAVYAGVKKWLVDRFMDVVNRIKGAIDKVTGFFRGMYDAVVGHSYVPDMLRGIKREFGQLDEVMVKPASDAAHDVEGIFGNLKKDTTDTVGGLMDDLSGLFTVDGLKKLFVDPVTTVLGILEDFITEVLNRLLRKGFGWLMNLIGLGGGGGITPLTPGINPLPLGPGQGGFGPGPQLGQPSYAMGTGGRFFDFGAGTLAALHGMEAVVRPQDAGSLAGAIVRGMRERERDQAPAADSRPRQVSVNVHIEAIDGASVRRVVESRDFAAAFNRAVSLNTNEVGTAIRLAAV